MGSIFNSIIGFISFLIRIYTIIIIIRAIISWVQPNPYNPIVQMLYKLTEPVLSPIRRILSRLLPNFGIDFSPFVAIIILEIIRSML
jgi:YggT family protein